MKKVRIVAGAAVPALGMLAMPATAAHAATHTHTAVKADAACTPISLYQGAVSSAHGHFEEVDSISAFSCVHFIEGILHFQQTGLTDRIRLWTDTNPNHLIYSRRIAGTTGSGRTTWRSTPNQRAAEACEALVANGTSTVDYGPDCLYP